MSITLRFLFQALTAALMSMAITWGPTAISRVGTAVAKAPGVTLDPGQGPPGTYVKAHYPGCTEPSSDPGSSTDGTVSYEIIAIAWNRQWGDAMIRGDSFTVPADAKSGTYSVEVYCSNSDREGTTFTVTEPHDARQDLLLKPDRGPTGTTVAVTGIGFNCSAVRVSWTRTARSSPGSRRTARGTSPGRSPYRRAPPLRSTRWSPCARTPLYQATAYFTVTEEETTGTTGTTTDGQNNGGTTGDTGDTDGAVGSDGGTDSGGVGDTDDGDTAVPVAWVV